MALKRKTVKKKTGSKKKVTNTSVARKKKKTKPVKKTAKTTRKNSADDSSDVISPKKLKWSIPGKAFATILFPHSELNTTVVTQLTPCGEITEARRGIIGDRDTNDDHIKIENFDVILQATGDPRDRIISVDLLHVKRRFTLFLAFSFLGADAGPGEVFEVVTNPSGITRFDIEVTM